MKYVTENDFSKPIIIDNVLPPLFANEIEQIMFSTDFAWYFLSDIAVKTEQQEKEYFENIGFVHMLFKNGKQTSPYFPMVNIIPHLALQKSNYNSVFYIHQARSFMHVKPSDKKCDGVHIDINSKHVVCLYYVNDADGDTYIFGKNNNTKVSQKIKPKKNRVVLFDGDIYHASSSPRHGQRVVINFDLIDRQTHIV